MYFQCDYRMVKVEFCVHVAIKYIIPWVEFSVKFNLDEMNY